MELYAWLLCYNNIVIDQKHRLLFCPIPKVACTNWKITLRIAANLGDHLNEDLAHDRQNNGLDYLCHHNRLMRFWLLNNPTFTKACFVRNPWTRILSAYRNKIENALTENGGIKKSKKSWIYRTINRAKTYCRQHNLVEDDGPEELTFGEFLHYLEGQAPENLNEHWRPQWLISGIDKIRYDFVGRFEYLEQDATVLTQKLGLPDLYNGPIVTVPKSNSGMSRILQHYYTSSRIEQVQRIYAKDIDLLGYTFPEG